MPEHDELGNIGQWEDELLGAMRGYLKALRSKLADLEALAAQAPPVEKRPGLLE